jgi:tripeptide aminopeptidase
MSNLVDRFLHYVSFDTQSNENSLSFPSTEKQLTLSRELAHELRSLGLTDASVDINGYVTATLTANCEYADTVPVIGFLAHMDTSPDASGAGIKPRIVTSYDGGDIVLNAEHSMVLSPAVFPDMRKHVGEDFIVTDGTTLLGADDKAGIAEIMTAVEYLLQHPEIRHGTVKVAFTPDEEVGQGVDRFDVAQFGARYAYTLDGDELGSLEYENFNAASAHFVVIGKSIHPGSAKNIMKNAGLIAAELTTLFPADETPRSTEKYEGFYHLTAIDGTCEKAEIKYILRDHDKQRFEQRKSMPHAICDFLNAKHGENTVTVQVHDSYYNMREVIEENMVLIDVARAVMEKLGITPLIKPVRGGTDGARLSYMGLPCPNLFTGGRNYHGPLEYVVIQSMERAVQVVVGIIQAFAAHSDPC